MIYKKEYKIEGKIITKNDITNIINSVLTKMSKEESFLSIVAMFNDGTSIEEKKLSLLDHIYFEKKVLERIDVNIGNNNFDNTIFITFSNKLYYNKVNIKANDKILFDSICHNIEESLKLMDNQKRLYILSEKFWGYILIEMVAISLEVLLVLILEYIFKLKIATALVYIMVILVPIIITPIIIKYIEKYYPVNQFYLSDSSVNKPRKSKGYILKIISFIITNILLPIIISIITQH